MITKSDSMRDPPAYSPVASTELTSPSGSSQSQGGLAPPAPAPTSKRRLSEGEQQAETPYLNGGSPSSASQSPRKLRSQQSLVETQPQAQEPPSAPYTPTPQPVATAPGKHDETGEENHGTRKNCSRSAPSMAPGNAMQEFGLHMCMEGKHMYRKKYGVAGIVLSVFCFPCGMLALIWDKEDICQRCGVRKSDETS